jgi:hypothetical protein
MLEAITNDSHTRPDAYEYIVDREIALNTGRLFGITIFITSLTIFGEQTTLRATPLAFSLLLIPILYFAKKLNQTAVSQLLSSETNARKG